MRTGTTLPLTAPLALAASILAVGHPTAARAFCSRPGTPDQVVAVAKSPTAIEFSWRDTTNKGSNPSNSVASGDTPYQGFFDIFIRGPNNSNPGKDLNGDGPYDGLVYGSRSSHVFDGLASTTRYCIAIRARTDAGTRGCVSAVTSAWACAVTPAAAPPAARCPAGLVWRERFDGDTVCVMPSERDANRRRRGLPVDR